MIKHLKITYLQRKFIKQSELNILVFKNLLTFHNLINNINIQKYFLTELFLTFNRFSSRSRTNSVCLFTGRTRAVSRKTFRLTRMQIKEKVSLGLFAGISKSSW